MAGRVHRGFKDALEEVWPDILPYIKKLESKGCKIWITAHSLGAALATLCAARYGKVPGSAPGQIRSCRRAKIY